MSGTWSVTITDNNNTTHSPAIVTPRDLNLPQRIPAANGRPRLEIGVPREPDSNDEPKWFDSKFEEADISVSLDGTDQPYSTLISVSDRPAAGVAVLTAEGGDELDNRIQKSFGTIPTHEAASQVISDGTSYDTDVPTPSTTSETVLVQDTPNNVFAGDVEPIPEDNPAYVTEFDRLSAHQTLHFHDPSTTLSAVGDTISFTADLGYSIPADRVGLAILTDATAAPVGYELAVDGTVIGEQRPGEDPGGVTWLRYTGSDDRLAAGSHTVEITVTAERDAAGSTLSSMSPSGVALYDDGYSYDWDTALVNGPQLYPANVDVPLKEPLVTRAVTGLRFRGYWANNQPGGQILSNGVELGEVAGAFPNLVDFDERGPVADVTVRLQRYGSDSNETPESGLEVTELTGWRLYADLEDMPLIVDEQFEGRVGQVLTEMTDTLRGDFVWAYDTDSNGDSVVRFVRTGSRSNSESNLEDYSVTKQFDAVLDEITVLGGPVSVDGERFRADYGTAVDLNRDNVVEGSETVSDPDADGDVVYERDTHYTIDYADGTITALADPPGPTSPIPDGARLTVAYEYQPRATAVRDGATDPKRSETVDSLPLRTDGACRLAAKQLLDAVASPTYDASAEIRGNTTYSVVAELSSAALPVAAGLETTDITATPGGTSVRLEARQSLDDAVSEIRDRIESVARHTR